MILFTKFCLMKRNCASKKRADTSCHRLVGVGLIGDGSAVLWIDAMTRIAVIGTGLSGLVFANMLGDAAQIKLFEKSGGYGGRMATRRHDAFQFDHGAQYFTARSKSFGMFLEPFIAAGVVARWHARIVEIGSDGISSNHLWTDERPHYVGWPGMNAFGRAIGEKLDTVLETHVAEISGQAGDWWLRDFKGRDLGRFDWVVSSVPARQVSILMPQEFCHLEAVEGCNMPGCYTLMLGFAKPLALEWDAARVKDAAISWISVDNSKPGRVGGTSLLVQTNNQWAEANMEREAQDVIAQLMAETSRVIGQDIRQDINKAKHVALHRWRYANPDQRQEERSFIDFQQQLAAIGDWCIGGRVESAFLSGRDAARRIRSQV